jgi:membrane protease YdiL (CAAX protease family)
MRKLLGIDPRLAVGGGGLTNVLLSFGAGVHEELVFRLGACAGGAALLRLVGLGHRTAVAIAFVISSALFSAAHHVGALGDPWSFQVFVYRTLAGLLFAAIFYFRSLAHAAYAHALYDVYVMVIQGS